MQYMCRIAKLLSIVPCSKWHDMGILQEVMQHKLVFIETQVRRLRGISPHACLPLTWHCPARSARAGPPIARCL